MTTTSSTDPARRGGCGRSTAARRTQFFRRATSRGRSTLGGSVTLTTQVALLPDGSEIVVTDPAGLRVDDGTITINDVSATVGLKPLVASGIYRAT